MKLHTDTFDPMTLPFNFTRNEGIALPRPAITFYRQVYRHITTFSVEPVEPQPSGSLNFSRITVDDIMRTPEPTPLSTMRMIDDDPTRDYVLDRTFRSDEPRYRYLKS